MPGTSGQRAAARGARHDRPSESEPGCLAQAPLEARYGPQLAEQPDLADRDGPIPDRPVAERRAEGERDRQVEPRFADRQSAGEVDVDVVTGEPDARPAGRGPR